MTLSNKRQWDVESDVGWHSSNDLMVWLAGRDTILNWWQSLSLSRCSQIGMRLAMASISPKREVQKVFVIYKAAFCCIFPSFLNK